MSITVQDIYLHDTFTIESDRDEVIFSVGDCPSHSVRLDVEGAKVIRAAIDDAIKRAETF